MRDPFLFKPRVCDSTSLYIVLRFRTRFHWIDVAFSCAKQGPRHSAMTTAWLILKWPLC